RVSRHGGMALCWTLDKLGPLCRTADDSGLVLAAIAGRDSKDPTTFEEKFNYSRASSKGRKFKLGIIKGTTEKAQPEVQKNFANSCEILKQFAHVTPDVELPDFPYGPVIDIIVNAEGASAFSDWIESGQVEQLKAPKDRIGGYVGLRVSAVDYLRSLRVWGLLTQVMDHLLSSITSIVATML